MESILFSFETVSSLETMKGSAKEFIKDLSLLDLVSRYEKDIMTEALKKSTSIRKAAKKTENMPHHSFEQNEKIENSS